MTFIYIAIAILVGLGVLVAIGSRGRNNEPNDQANTAAHDCTTCSGEDDRCEQVCYMEAATREIEYYDDEELDQYRDRPADSYTEEEIEQFAEVLSTLQPSDAKGWARSLSLRQIELPNCLKDDLFAMIDG